MRRRADRPQKLDDNEAIEFTGFVDALTAVEQTNDFIVIDTPGTDNHLTRLAHSMADTLVTPINDSYVDFDVLGRVDPTTFTVTGESHYAKMVREARLQRRLVDGARMDWVVMRNRLALFESGSKERLTKGLAEMAMRIGFRVAEGLAERVVYREFFPRGLTALDDLDARARPEPEPPPTWRPGRRWTGLMETIRLPLDERGQKRAAAQAKWMGGAGRAARGPRRHCRMNGRQTVSRHSEAPANSTLAGAPSCRVSQGGWEGRDTVGNLGMEPPETSGRLLQNGRRGRYLTKVVSRSGGILGTEPAYLPIDACKAVEPMAQTVRERARIRQGREGRPRDRG